MDSNKRQKVPGFKTQGQLRVAKNMPYGNDAWERIFGMNHLRTVRDVLTDSMRARGHMYWTTSQIMWPDMWYAPGPWPQNVMMEPKLDQGGRQYMRKNDAFINHLRNQMDTKVARQEAYMLNLEKYYGFTPRVDKDLWIPEKKL
jgi:hypothetical protein